MRGRGKMAGSIPYLALCRLVTLPVPSCLVLVCHVLPCVLFLTVNMPWHVPAHVPCCAVCAVCLLVCAACCLLVPSCLYGLVLLGHAPHLPAHLLPHHHLTTCLMSLLSPSPTSLPSLTPTVTLPALPLPLPSLPWVEDILPSSVWHFLEKAIFIKWVITVGLGLGLDLDIPCVFLHDVFK